MATTKKPIALMREGKFATVAIGHYATRAEAEAQLKMVQSDRREYTGLSYFLK